MRPIPDPASAEAKVEPAYWRTVAPSLPKKPDTVIPARGTLIAVEAS